MTVYVTPSVGSAGTYQFKAPVDKILSNTIKYSCISVKTLQSLISEGIDVYKTIYEPLGLSKTNYSDDFKDSLNVNIVTLSAGLNSKIEVPNSFILGLPTIDGVYYTRMMLGVSLGPISDQTNLAGIESSIEDLIFTRLGVVPEIKQVAVSATTMVSLQDHARIEAIRKAKISLNKSNEILLAESNRDLKIALERIRELEAYIVSKSSV